MKFDFNILKSDYAQTIEDLVKKQTQVYADSFLSTWKDKWVCILDANGWHYGKVVDCDFGYFYYTNVIDMNVTVSLPTEEQVTFREVIEITEMSEKQKTFLDMKYLLMDYLSTPDENGFNEDIKELLFQLDVFDIKSDEKNNN